VAEDGLRRLMSESRLSALHAVGPVYSSLPPEDAPTGGRFEGAYGRLYNGIIQTPAIRRVVFGAWGSADPLMELERFVSDAVTYAGSSADRVLVDVPSGGGTLLPLLVSERFGGTVVEVDVAARMLQRAVALHHSLAPSFRTVFLRSDARDLPLRENLADVVVSINGLHVISDPDRFVAEMARITRPGGGIWVVSPVDGPGLRSKAILTAANWLGITPQTPPTRSRLRELLAGAGLEELRDYGGSSIAGLAVQKSAA
jgi:SAM-dependent methyltransferase